MKKKERQTNHNIKGGYYIKARCIRDSWISHSAPVVRETWDYLLREANHKERKYKGYTIKRGQLFRTYREIRDGLCWMAGNSRRTYSVNQMKHTMKLLSKHLMITLANQPRGVLITVCNYSHYQDPKNYESTTESSANQPPNHPPINRASPTINKNVKNEKNEKKEPKPTADFLKFISIYPNKKAKNEAWVAWQQLFIPEHATKKTAYIGLDNGLLDTIYTAVPEQIKEKEWKARLNKEAGKIIHFVSTWPNPATWLRGMRWEDEVLPEPDDFEPNQFIDYGEE